MRPLMVTGGCGFIGQQLPPLRAGERAGGVARQLRRPHLRRQLANLADLDKHPRYRFVHGDITDREAVRAVVARDSTVS